MVARSRSILYSDPITDLMTGCIDHFIVGTSAGFQTDYPILIRVYRKYGSNTGNTVYIPGSELQSNYSDIRFVTDTGIICTYWIESSSSTYADIWVVIPFLPTTGTILKIVYGAGNIASASNSSATFPTLFDHFDGASVDATKWDTSGSGISVASSAVTISGAVGNVISKSAVNTYGYAHRFYGSLYSYNVGNPVIGTADSLSFNTYILFDGYEASSSGYYSLSHYSAGSQDQNNIGTTAYTGNRVWEIQFISTTSRKFYVDNAQVGAEHTTSLSTSHKTLLRNGATDSNIVIDWALIRKIANPEPTHGWWGLAEDL